jgi:hypothetical protein
MCVRPSRPTYSTPQTSLLPREGGGYPLDRRHHATAAVAADAAVAATHANYASSLSPPPPPFSPTPRLHSLPLALLSTAVQPTLSPPIPLSHPPSQLIPSDLHSSPFIFISLGTRSDTKHHASVSDVSPLLHHPSQHLRAHLYIPRTRLHIHLHLVVTSTAAPPPQ